MVQLHTCPWFICRNSMTLMNPSCLRCALSVKTFALNACVNNLTSVMWSGLSESHNGVSLSRVYYFYVHGCKCFVNKMDFLKGSHDRDLKILRLLIRKSIYVTKKLNPPPHFCHSVLVALNLKVIGWYNLNVAKMSAPMWKICICLGGYNNLNISEVVCIF